MSTQIGDKRFHVITDHLVEVIEFGVGIAQIRPQPAQRKEQCGASGKGFQIPVPCGWLRRQEVWQKLPLATGPLNRGKTAGAQ